MAEEAFYLSPEFWVALAFGAFVILISRPLVRVIAQALDKRSAEIANELAEAQRLKREAQDLLSMYQQKQRESLEEASSILSNAQADADRMTRHAEEELKTALDKRLKLSMEKIAQAETKALQEVQNNVVDIAIAAARTIIAEHLSRGGNEELIKQAAVELERKLH